MKRSLLQDKKLVTHILSAVVLLASFLIPFFTLIGSAEARSIYFLDDGDIVDVSPTADNGYHDVDCSAYIPEGATGVILHIYSTSSFKAYAIRKNGSSNDYNCYIGGGTNAHLWAAIGVDENRIFEAKRNNSAVHFLLTGYTTTGTTFFTNAYDKSTSPLSNWNPTDLSTECPDAVGVILQFRNEGTYATGARMSGSTDTRTQVTEWDNDSYFTIVGCNETQHVDLYQNNGLVDILLIGYITEGATFYTNATVVSLGSTGSYVNIDASLPELAGGVFVEVVSSNEYKYHLREEGTAGNQYYDVSMHACSFIQVEEGTRLFEGKIENAAVDFFVLGWVSTFDGTPIVVNESPSSVTNVTARLNGDLTYAGGVDTTVHIYWGDNDGGTTPESWDEDENLGVTAEGTFYYDASGLTKGTQYFYRCYATNEYGNAWANSTESFYTLWEVPAIETLSEISLLKTTVTFRGNLTDTGGGAGSEATVKFYYGDNDGTTYPGIWDEVEIVTGQSVGTVSANITGLSADTTYYYRAYVENVQQSAWADTTVSFTTGVPGLATVITDNAVNITATEVTLSATLQDDGGSPCAIWIAYGPTQACNYHTGYAIDRVSGQSYIETVDELFPDTVYYYLAVAYVPPRENIEGVTSYGALKTFRTLDTGLSQPYSITLPFVKVFRNVQQTDDRLIFARYDVKYRTDPTEPADEYYLFYLGDESGSPLYLAPVVSYGQGFAGLYLAPEHTFEWESTDYTIVVTAKTAPVEGTNMDTYTLTAGDYETDLKNIRPTVDDIIWYIEEDKDVRYLTAEGLNIAGMDYCKRALPGFELVYPYPYTPAYTERDYDQTYAETLASRWDGTTYGTARDNLADYVGMTPMWFTSIIWLALMTLISYLVATSAKSAKPVLLLMIPMLIGGALLGFMPLVVTILIGFASVLGIGYVFFYRSTT